MIFPLASDTDPLYQKNKFKTKKVIEEVIIIA